MKEQGAPGMAERVFDLLKIQKKELIPKFNNYMEEILNRNRFINLTAITEREDFWIRHYADSLLCWGFPEVREAERIIDIGTGAGFPGVPLAFLFPEKNFVLADSLRKRLRIIEDLCREAALLNVRTLHGRAEDLGRMKEHRERYRLCVSRAVAPLPVLAEYTLPFLETGGSLLAYKGPEAEEELRQARKAVHLLGGETEEIRDAGLESLGLSHRIVVIRKVRSTPASYPRKAGTPSREPL